MCQYHQRLTCCNGINPGSFDYNACVANLTLGGWRGATSAFTPEILARGNVSLHGTAAQACLAGLGALSCPLLPSTEDNTVTDDCYAATTGTLGLGASCLDSIECQETEYCKFAGVDAGQTDAGTQLGQCAPLIVQGQACGQAPPYGAPSYTSAECAYKGWHYPPEFCDYRGYPDASTYSCRPLLGNGATCFNSTDCASGVCGSPGVNCRNTACTCVTSLDLTIICTAFAIQDAGPG